MSTNTNRKEFVGSHVYEIAVVNFAKEPKMRREDV